MSRTDVELKVESLLVELRQAVRDLLAENIRLRQMIVDLKDQIALYEYETDDHK